MKAKDTWDLAHSQGTELPHLPLGQIADILHFPGLAIGQLPPATYPSKLHLEEALESHSTITCREPKGLRLVGTPGIKLQSPPVPQPPSRPLKRRGGNPSSLELQANGLE